MNMVSDGKYHIIRRVAEEEVSDATQLTNMLLRFFSSKEKVSLIYVSDTRGGLEFFGDPMAAFLKQNVARAKEFIERLIIVLNESNFKKAGSRMGFQGLKLLHFRNSFELYINSDLEEMLKTFPKEQLPKLQAVLDAARRRRIVSMENGKLILPPLKVGVKP